MSNSSNYLKALDIVNFRAWVTNSNCAECCQMETNELTPGANWGFVKWYEGRNITTRGPTHDDADATMARVHEPYQKQLLGTKWL